MRFSIIVVCLNPGEKLNQTLDSILSQSYDDYEIIVKDGGSRDDSIETMRKDSHIHLYQEKDTGIYDAMNQAVSYVKGDYILFLNCGDVFYNEMVLEKAAEYIDNELRQEGAGQNVAQPNEGQQPLLVLYGDTFSGKNQVTIASAPQITGFTCYRNIPCHQVCFYAAALCREKPYDLRYKIRADYDHFLWCYYKGQAKMVHMDLTVASYEGDGFSEKKENVEKDRCEHREITSSYMTKGELLKYRLIMLATLAPIRRWMAENKAFSGMYHRLKDCIYGRKH